MRVPPLVIASILSLTACAGPDPGTEGASCPNDNTCLIGLRCVDGACRLSPDAGGPDAARPDAMIDAGRPIDAGPDAGADAEVDAGPVDAGPGPDCGIPLTMAAVQSQIFGAAGQAQCNQNACHGANAAGGISLLGPADTVRMRLLGPTQDPRAPERQLVVPGMPDQSRLYVIMANRNPGGAGGPMPPNVASGRCEVQTIRDWITVGAP